MHVVEAQFGAGSLLSINARYVEFEQEVFEWARGPNGVQVLRPRRDST